MQRALLAIGIAALAITMSGCGSGDPAIAVRAADGVQVMTPEEVAKMRPTVLPALDTTTTTTAASSGTTTPAPPAATNTAASAPAAAVTTAASSDEEPGETAADTIPQNKDDRPAELRLFDAFGKFRKCLESKGYKIEGDLRDPNNPAFKDAKYVEALQTCAARTDIANILQEVQATQKDMKPEDIKTRNEGFKVLAECLKRKGWTIETTTAANGLLQPSTFQDANGELDERDVNDCISETGILED